MDDKPDITEILRMVFIGLIGIPLGIILVGLLWIFVIAILREVYLALGL